MIGAARELRIPVLVGTAGGAAAEPHLQWTREMVREIARTNNLSFRLAIIHGEIERKIVLSARERSEISPLPPVGPLQREDILENTQIGGQMDPSSRHWRQARR